MQVQPKKTVKANDLIISVEDGGIIAAGIRDNGALLVHAVTPRTRFGCETWTVCRPQGEPHPSWANLFRAHARDLTCLECRRRLGLHEGASSASTPASAISA